MKECPMCGETMRLSVRNVTEALPGRSEPGVREMREWVCPECDYFEDTDAIEE